LAPVTNGKWLKGAVSQDLCLVTFGDWGGLLANYSGLKEQCHKIYGGLVKIGDGWLLYNPAGEEGMFPFLLLGASLIKKQCHQIFIFVC
jgi:hypothetical protein